MSTVRYTYDSLGRVTTSTNALGAFTNAYVNATPRLSSIAYPNGQTSTFSYLNNTNDQRLQTIWHKTSGGATVSKFDYTYDVEGQIKTWTQQADSATAIIHEFEYDPVNQLLGATLKNSATQALVQRHVYGYDKAGNRTSEQIGSSVSLASHNNVNQLTARSGTGPMRFQGSLNELGTVKVAGLSAAFDSRTTNFVGYADLSAGTNTVPVIATDYSANSRTNNYQIVVTNGPVAKTLAYDLNGNLVSVTTATSTNAYEWDAADRLLAVNIGTNRSEFAYDGLSRRVRIVEKTNGEVTSDKRFLWCGPEICEERDATGTNVTKRFFGQGMQHSGTNYFYTRDHLGSVRELTDASNSVLARYEYAPYGRRTKVSGDLEADFGFTGHYFHGPTGLHLALYRAYDADTARWISQDPIEEKGGFNLYGFVGNNPLRYVDPYGHAWYDWEWIDRAANFSAGLGDNLSFGLTERIRDAYPEFYGGVDKCAGAYGSGDKVGTGLSLATGIGRATYMGLTKVGSIVIARQGATAKNAMRAFEFRNALKVGLNLGLTPPTTKEYMVTRYGTDWAKWIAASGRTATGRENAVFGIPGSWNVIGAGYVLGNGLANKIDPHSCE